MHHISNNCPDSKTVFFLYIRGKEIISGRQVCFLYVVSTTLGGTPGILKLI
jgi:hypothetical protein